MSHKTFALAVMGSLIALTEVVESSPHALASGQSRKMRSALAEVKTALEAEGFDVDVRELSAEEQAERDADDERMKGEFVDLVLEHPRVAEALAKLETPVDLAGMVADAVKDTLAGMDAKVAEAVDGHLSGLDAKVAEAVKAALPADAAPAGESEAEVQPPRARRAHSSGASADA